MVQNKSVGFVKVVCVLLGRRERPNSYDSIFGASDEQVVGSSDAVEAPLGGRHSVLHQASVGVGELVEEDSTVGRTGQQECAVVGNGDVSDTRRVSPERLEWSVLLRVPVLLYRPYLDGAVPAGREEEMGSAGTAKVD